MTPAPGDRDDDPDTDAHEFDLEYRDDGVPIVPPPDPDARVDEEREMGVPDADPRRIDPAGELATLVEDGDLEIHLGEDTDRERLREFLDEATRDDVPADPGLEATVRIVRALLDDGGGEE